MLFNLKRKKKKIIQKRIDPLWPMKFHDVYFICNWNPRKRRNRNVEKNVKEIMAKMFPNFLENINLHILEAQWIWRRIKTKKVTHGHIMIKSLEDKDRGNLKVDRKEKKIIYRDSMIQMMANFSSETMELKSVNIKNPKPGNSKFSIKENTVFLIKADSIIVSLI